MRRFRREIERCANRLLDIVLIKLIAVSLVFPHHAAGLVKGLLETLIHASLFQVALHVGNVRVIGAKALVLVKHTQEDVQDGVAIVVRAGLAVDIEQHHVGRFTDSFSNISPDRAVYQLLLVKKISGPFGLAVGIKRFRVSEQVRKRFQKV